MRTASSPALALGVVGVRIVGRCKKLRQSLEVNLCSCWSAKGEPVNDEQGVTANAGTLTFREIGLGGRIQVVQGIMGRVSMKSKNE